MTDLVKGLKPDAIELLRSLPRTFGPTDNTGEAATLNRIGLALWESDDTLHRSLAADALLATIDALNSSPDSPCDEGLAGVLAKLTAERDEVLADTKGDAVRQHHYADGIDFALRTIAANNTPSPCETCKGKGYTTDGVRNEFGNLERQPCNRCKDYGASPCASEEVSEFVGGPRGGDPRFTTGTLSGDLRELAKLIREQTEQDWIGVTESNSVNETLENAQAWRHNCRVYAEGVEKAAGYVEDDGLAEAGRSVIADRLAEQLAAGVSPEDIEWPEAWANLAREIKRCGGGSRD